MMMTYVKSALVASLVLATSLVPAEDIDLFMGLESAGDEQLPNVLIVIDNTANWNTAFTAEMAALASTVAGLEARKFRLGFMLYTETGGSNKSPDGGYVRAAVRTMGWVNKPLYQSLVGSLDKNADKGNNGKLGLTMSEVDRYFSGSSAYAGHNKVKRDYHGNNVAGLAASNWIYSLNGNAFTSAADTTYESPVSDPNGCQRNYVIFLSNGKSNSNTADNTTAKSHLAAVGGNTTAVPIIPNGFQSEIADEWARYMASKAAGPVITYVIDVVPTVNGQYSNDYQALLKSMATQGQGKYFNVGSAGAGDVGIKIQAALEQIFGEIAAVNTAFSSASLPVSVNTQGVYLNQVFIGMFRPDRKALPRWNGNLKQYQIVASGATLNLAGRNRALAINPLTGFMTPCAVSYWTPEAVDDYWTFKLGEFANPCATVEGAAASNTPDGDAVEKGAAGYRLRAVAPADRVVKTCTGACAALANFNTSNADITIASLGVAAGDRDTLINWVRGQDLANENGDGETIGQMRPSVHGDVIHSRPLAVDYGGTTGVVVFYGGNDGMLHAVEGGKALTDGDELWSFVAPEHFGKLNRLRTDAPPINFPAKEPGDLLDLRNYADNKDYFMDGSVGGFRTAAGAVWIYPTMRRGGRMVYAFDVTTPASPSLLWRHGCTTTTDNTGCDADFTEIGQTWSAVQVFLALGYANPVAIFGGGYDTCEDNEPNTCATPKGDHIYMVDAQTGGVLKTFDTFRSVAADITVVDGDGNGKAELAYAVDTGGNIYRINIGSAVPADWTITQVAALGCDAPPCLASGTFNRKFLYAPEVVATSLYNAVLVGSGDREHPLDTNEAVGVVNAFFMVKDKPSDPAWLTDEAAKCGASLICMAPEGANCDPDDDPDDASLICITPEGANPTTDELDAKKGWYLAFRTDAGGVVHDGEQVVTAALVVGGVVYFSTHTPTESTAALCGPNLGTARAYGVNFLTAANPDSIPDGTMTRFSELVGGGLAPSPVGGLVEIDRTLYPFIIGGRQLEGGVTAGLEAQNAGLEVSGVRARTHWYIEPPAPQ
jgi:type IV pilus assembly protein PilY1